MTDELVIWHDLECGGYDVDRGLWRELAEAASGPILDVGAGTGRVALDLARRGHDVTALDADEVLLGALRERADGLVVDIAHADARTFELGRRFALILVPMQTVQLLDGPAGRARFLARARDHLAPGGRLAMAIADVLEGAGDAYDMTLAPDVREIDGIVYASRPVALRDGGDRVAIDRLREVVDLQGERRSQDDTVWLDALAPEVLEAEGRAAGLSVLPRLEVPATDEYVGSVVVMLGA